MNNREWIKRTLAHEETGAVPYNFAFAPPARQKVEKHYGGSPAEQVLNFPIRMTGLNSIKPLYASRSEYGDSIRDEYGVVWSTNDIDRGSPTGPCLPEPSLRGYSFPDATAEYRYSLLADWLEANRDSFTLIWVGDLWERATFMRGMENLLLDVILKPDLVKRLLRGITDYILKTMEILFSRFEFDCVAFSDDYGTQKSMLISPEEWRRFVRPMLKELYGFAKKHNRTVFHHTCGNVYPIVRDLIELGLDVLHPIQPEAMDIEKLKREFGQELSFCGGVRTQDLLPYGTPEQVRDEVRRLKQTMGKGGGYILEPGITLQVDIPIENLVALIDEARKTD